MSIFREIQYLEISILTLLVLGCIYPQTSIFLTLAILLGLLEFRQVIDKLSFKLSGDLDPKVKKVVDSINKAHENDKLLDEKISEINSKLSALNIKYGIERLNSD